MQHAYRLLPRRPRHGPIFLVGLNHSEANQGTCYGNESFGILDFSLNTNYNNI